jgi:hypothetical protein
MATFAEWHLAQSRATGVPSDREARKLLQFRVDLAQELLDVRHDRVRAVVLQISGRPPDSEGIDRLGSLTKDLEFARESLVDATCRLHYFLFSGKHAGPI